MSEYWFIFFLLFSLLQRRATFSNFLFSLSYLTLAPSLYVSFDIWNLLSVDVFVGSTIYLPPALPVFEPALHSFDTCRHVYYAAAICIRRIYSAVACVLVVFYLLFILPSSLLNQLLIHTDGAIDLPAIVSLNTVQLMFSIRVAWSWKH